MRTSPIYGFARRNYHATDAVSDNRALFKASKQAHRDGVPVVALFVISPQDYIAHDRGARKIDFTLRNLRVLKVSPGKSLTSSPY